MLDAYSAEGERRPFLSAYHDIFDELAGSPAEFATFYVIYRETEGYSHESWPISESTLLKRTGIKSPKTLAKVLIKLAHRGLIKMWDELHNGCTRWFALGDKLKSFIPLVKNTRGVEENAVVQRQLVQEEGSAEVIPLVKNTGGGGKKYQGGGKKYQGGVVKNTIDASSQTMQEEAREDAKESIKKEERKEERKDVSDAPADIKIEIEQFEEKEETWTPPPLEWSATLDRLKEGGRVSVAQFNTWIKPVEAHHQGDQFLLVVESSFHKEHLQRISREVRGILEPLLPPTTDIFVLTKKEFVLQAIPATVPARSSA